MEHSQYWYSFYKKNDTIHQFSVRAEQKKQFKDFGDALEFSKEYDFEIMMRDYEIKGEIFFDIFEFSYIWHGEKPSINNFDEDEPSGYLEMRMIRISPKNSLNWAYSRNN